ncbi:paramyosin-related protein [Artemisia annua]|uniref:Paramyosin-related protein n=1 Tax=Artemisia annua TaxID=35608 RepID=A0A2U1NKK2_ARTAN|nr:paramyosin-related protein [Artemisia annua]
MILFCLSSRDLLREILCDCGIWASGYRNHWAGRIVYKYFGIGLVTPPGTNCIGFGLLGKLRQTRKYYVTYNALLEIKELMLKETSLLNSMSSQFHDALNTPAGRATVTSSMEGISKSIQQKLQNVQLTLQAEQKACEALKKKHAAANLEKRRCYILLKAFQVRKTINTSVSYQFSSRYSSCLLKLLTSKYMLGFQPDLTIMVFLLYKVWTRMNALEMRDFRTKVQRFQYRC